MNFTDLMIADEGFLANMKAKKLEKERKAQETMQKYMDSNKVITAYKEVCKRNGWEIATTSNCAGLDEMLKVWCDRIKGDLGIRYLGLTNIKIETACGVKFIKATGNGNRTNPWYHVPVITDKTAKPPIPHVKIIELDKLDL